MVFFPLLSLFLCNFPLLSFHSLREREFRKIFSNRPRLHGNRSYVTKTWLDANTIGVSLYFYFCLISLSIFLFHPFHFHYYYRSPLSNGTISYAKIEQKEAATKSHRPLFQTKTVLMHEKLWGENFRLATVPPSPSLWKGTLAWNRLS